jgi:hypothetical protein
MKPHEVVRAFVEAFNRADADALASLYADDAINHQVAESPVEGREAIRRMFIESFASATMTCIVENLFENGNGRLWSGATRSVSGAAASCISLTTGSCSSGDTGTSSRSSGPRAFPCQKTCKTAT